MEPHVNGGDPSCRSLGAALKVIRLSSLTMPANSEKPHLSIVICGHVDSGKSTTTGRLIFDAGWPA